MADNNSDAPQSADIHLVAYGLGTDRSGEQLKQWLKENEINVKACNLLTRFEGARSLSYKLVVKASDYGKTINPAIWLENVGVRKFLLFDGTKKRNLGVNQNNRELGNQPGGSPNDDNQKRNRKYGNKSDTRRIWNPPSKELMMQYQRQNGLIEENRQPSHQYPILPYQPQKILYTPPNIWTSPQQSRNVQDERLRQIPQPQVKILQRNGKDNITSSQVSQQIMQSDVGMLAANPPVFRLGDNWSMGYSA